MGAFSVGQHVFQVEFGNRFEYMKHESFSDSKVIGYGIDLSVRYGFFRDQLEAVWDLSYQFDQLQSRFGIPGNFNRNGAYRNSIGAKYLFYDPFKYKGEEKEAERDRKIDTRSWKANNKFRWRKLIPAIAVYGGFNVNFGDTYAYGNYFADFQVIGLPDSSDEPTFSPRVALATQSHPHRDWVITTNISYNRIATDFPELGFIATVTHNYNDDWSFFLESQTIDSDVYADQLFRGGAAYLFSKDLQFEATLGGNIKSTPSRIFGNIGVSYRIGNHTDDDAMSFERYKKKLKKDAYAKETKKRNSIKKERKLERREKKRKKKNKKDREQRALDEFVEDVDNSGDGQQTDEGVDQEGTSGRSKVRNNFRETIEEDDGSWRDRVNEEIKEEMRLEEEEKELRRMEKELRKEEKELRKIEKKLKKEEKKKEKKKKKNKKREQDVLDDFNENR